MKQKTDYASLYIQVIGFWGLAFVHVYQQWFYNRCGARNVKSFDVICLPDLFLVFFDLICVKLLNDYQIFIDQTHGTSTIKPQLTCFAISSHLLILDTFLLIIVQPFL